MPLSRSSTVADIEGPWVDCDFQSSLIKRCKRGWNTPVSELTNELLATYLRQRLALAIVVPEAKRIAEGYVGDTEMYDEELANALRQVKR